ncbi:hypothetical protein BT93_D1952 [Corymbia citriodora subsp. variegata]|nr:hypothetical protein BT93_D1952 [Corymbia citriodora subsp. variegata]
MGNCAETCRQRRGEEIWKDPEELRVRGTKSGKTATSGGSAAKISMDRRGGGVAGKADGGGGGGRVRVKIVLTKEELELLLFQLGRDGGRKGGPKSNLEQVLGEIERGRRRNGGVGGGGDSVDGGSWKPSLDSILEVPELPEMERS